MSFCPLSTIKSPRLIEFAAYLESKRQDGSDVLRASIDPIVEVPKIVSTLLLIERIRDDEQDQGRFKIRLVGSGLAAIAGRDLTGRWLDEAGLAENLATLSGQLRAIFATPGIFAGSRVLPWKERDHVIVEWVATRLASVRASDDLVIFAFDKQPDSD